MCRIHPTDSKRRYLNEVEEEEPSAVVLTVWKKSSLSFQGTDGFSVFDSHGKLAFRLDNYSRASRCTAGALLLMDGSGKPLLTIKPKIMSMHGQWNVSEEEGAAGAAGTRQIFSMRRRRMVQGRDEAVIFMCGSGTDVPDFKINGCFRRRHCKIWSGKGEVVAEISRKRANNKSTVLLTDDVFNLVIKPGNDIDTKLIMAFVVIMDRISNKAFKPALCV